jgi:putative Mg2+ transporter-C (MgtC) family protein
MYLLNQQMTLEVLGEVSIYIGMGVQIVTALILGGVVGFDREQKMKAAGLKTNIMICIGSTLYTSISYLTMDQSTSTADLNRVAAQIVSGIGFLGAGAIIQGRGSVTGLTTAATIWVVAAIGYTIGVGHILIASLFSFTVLLVLRLLGPLNRVLESYKQFKRYHLEILSRGSITDMVKNILAQESLEVFDVHEDDQNDRKNRKILNLYLETHPKVLERLVTELQTVIRVEQVSYHVLADDEVIDQKFHESDI